MRRFWLLTTAISVLALAVPSLVSLPKKLVYNASASAPIGLYWIDQVPILQGDYALISVPERVRKLVEERQYLPPNVPLIKRVVGIEGDRICRRGQQILINGVAVAVAQKADRSGRLMPVWDDCYILSGRRVFLLQDHPRSFDGRYFGPVDRRLIIGRATKLRFSWRKREQS